MAKSYIAASTALQIVSPLLFLTVLVQNNAINVAPGVAVAIVALLRLQLLQYRTEESYFWTSFLRDAQYFDIPFDEEDQHALCQMPRQNIRFGSWTDQKCYNFTGFKTS